MTKQPQHLVEYYVYTVEDDEIEYREIDNFLNDGRAHEFGNSIEGDLVEEGSEEDGTDDEYDEFYRYYIAVRADDVAANEFFAEKRIDFWHKVKTASTDEAAKLFRIYLATGNKFEGLSDWPFADEAATLKKGIRGNTTNWRDGFVPSQQTPSRPALSNDVVSRFHRQPKWLKEKLRNAIRKVEAGKIAKKAEL